MPANVLIRPAEPGDSAALGRLGALLVHAHHEFDRRRFLAPGDGIEEGYARFLLGQLEDPDVVIFVAVLDGDVVGYVYAGIEPRSWKELRDVAGFVHDVAVDASARGRGIAARLVEAAADWLEQHGAPRVMLWTAERNGAGQRLFEKLGFRRTMIEMTRERKDS